MSPAEAAKAWMEGEGRALIEATVAELGRAVAPMNETDERIAVALERLANVAEAWAEGAFNYHRGAS